jgi:PKD repeat protein
MPGWSVAVTDPTTINAIVPAGMPDGVYNLAIFNGDCQEAILPDAFTVTSVPIPITGLEATNDSPTHIGETTHFTATVETGNGVSYTWAFGDGSHANGRTSQHVYADLGMYTAIVTATNVLNSEVATTTVSIVDVPITGLQAANDSPTELGDPTALNATIATGTTITYAWDFGDGMTGTGDVVTHTYASVGLYTAIVTATNDVSSSCAQTDFIITDVPISGLTAANDSPTELGNPTTLIATIGTGTNVTYAWDFGDGASGTGDLTTHAYPAAGIYTATVTATNTAGSAASDTLVTIVDAPITGLMAASDSPNLLGSMTTLTATILNGTNVTYAWDFGDGTSGIGVVDTHTYLAVGSYTAVVTATNSLGTAGASTIVTVTDVPIAGLHAANDSPTELGDMTTLTATLLTGTNVTFEWDFGDGTTGAGAVDTHTYPALGVYTAIVTATNGTSSESASTVVTITDVPITGLMAANDGPMELGNLITLTATIMKGTNVSYTWDFGDGTTGAGQVVTHLYTEAGVYTATVTATNSMGSVTATTQVTIFVSPHVVHYIFVPVAFR